jgi:DNA (cytosine-5)-methyltransferase 1
MNRPRLLDLFCGAGGAGVGYQEAGFDVVGVDLRPQPRYPFPFVQADALESPFRLSDFDAIHASPPCQAHTTMSARWRGKGSLADERPELIGPTRAMLVASGVPYVIENVPGAVKHLRNPLRLTGEHFGLGVHRPRLFECSFFCLTPTAPPRQADPVAVYGKMDGRRLWTREDGSILRAPKSLDPAAVAMGIDWMEWDELREAIPPAYTHYLGLRLLENLEQRGHGTLSDDGRGGRGIQGKDQGNTHPRRGLNDGPRALQPRGPGQLAG